MIARRLRRVRLGRSALSTSVVTAAAALLVAGAVLSAFEFLLLRRDFVDDISAQVEATAGNSTAAVMFDDADAAAETLAALRTLPGLAYAQLLRGDGSLLAAMGNADADTGADVAVVASQWPGGGHRVSLSELTVAAPVMVNGRRVGTLVVRMGLDRLHSRLANFILMFLVVGLGALGVSVLLMWRLRRQVGVAERQLDRMAHYDAVTELRNRNAFNVELDKLRRARAAQDGGHIGLLLLDVDGFKTVNDSLGHQRGDALLAQIAARLAATVGHGDRAYRIGGDEFAIVARSVASTEEAEAYGRRLMAQFERPFVVADHELHVTVSCGISLAPPASLDVRALTTNADTALYQAKRGGRNAFEMFRPEMNQRAEQRLRLRAELRRALDEDALTLDYQPQLAMGSGRIVGVEALVRWHHPELGVIAPATFIPVAEESGLIVPLGRWVITAACRQLRQWRTQGLDGFRVAVNMSVRQMRDSGLPDFIDATLADCDLDPGSLELEITESLLLDDAETQLALLRSLRARGIRLAIDDFGTGFSSMGYLPRLPIDQLKIDASFVQRIPGDGEAITTAIIAMAHRLRLEVVAEGVETAVQSAYLREAGCDLMQGFLFSPPLAPERVTALLLDQQGPCAAGAQAAPR